MKLSEDANIILGHTRMETQGDCKKNYNNHPFFGEVRNTKFALAHNGIVYNDFKCQSEVKLPKSHIEMDSYVAVQLIEKSGELSEKTLAKMAEKINGPFVFTALSERNNSYLLLRAVIRLRCIILRTDFTPTQARIRFLNIRCKFLVWINCRIKKSITIAVTF